MKKLFVLIVTLVAAVALVGCGEPSGTDASIAETNYTVETVENLKAQADDSVLVSFRIPFGTSIQAVIREFADEFEELYPSVKIELDVNQEYQFRYLLDGYKWENDWKADKYIPAPYSNADNSVVVTKLPSKK